MDNMNINNLTLQNIHYFFSIINSYKIMVKPTKEEQPVIEMLKEKTWTGDEYFKVMNYLKVIDNIDLSLLQHYIKVSLTNQSFLECAQYDFNKLFNPSDLIIEQGENGIYKCNTPSGIDRCVSAIVYIIYLDNWFIHNENKDINDFKMFYSTKKSVSYLNYDKIKNDGNRKLYCADEEYIVDKISAAITGESNIFKSLLDKKKMSDSNYQDYDITIRDLKKIYSNDVKINYSNDVKINNTSEKIIEKLTSIYQLNKKYNCDNLYKLPEDNKLIIELTNAYNGYNPNLINMMNDTVLQPFLDHCHKTHKITEKNLKFFLEALKTLTSMETWLNGHPETDIISFPRNSKNNNYDTNAIKNYENARCFIRKYQESTNNINNTSAFLVDLLNEKTNNMSIHYDPRFMNWEYQEKKDKEKEYSPKLKLLILIKTIEECKKIDEHFGIEDIGQNFIVNINDNGDNKAYNIGQYLYSARHGYCTAFAAELDKYFENTSTDWKAKRSIYNLAGTSVPEKYLSYVIKTLLNDYDFNIYENDRTNIIGLKGRGVELDLLSEDNNKNRFALEYDGLIFHKDKIKEDVHKSVECIHKGITLFRVREPGLSSLKEEILKTLQEIYPDDVSKFNKYYYEYNMNDYPSYLKHDNTYVSAKYLEYTAYNILKDLATVLNTTAFQNTINEYERQNNSFDRTGEEIDSKLMSYRCIFNDKNIYEKINNQNITNIDFFSFINSPDYTNKIQVKIIKEHEFHIDIKELEKQLKNDKKQKQDIINIDDDLDKIDSQKCNNFIQI